MNYHDGNEYFRKLVRKHKLDYVNCPKQQKGKFSKMIVDEIKARNPPGRFLKQDKDTKLWYDIGEKKALDKTRQALREGAPELMNNGKPSSSKEETAGDTALNKVRNRLSNHPVCCSFASLPILKPFFISSLFGYLLRFFTYIYSHSYFLIDSLRSNKAMLAMEILVCCINRS